MSISSPFVGRVASAVVVAMLHPFAASSVSAQTCLGLSEQTPELLHFSVGATKFPDGKPRSGLADPGAPAFRGTGTNLHVRAGAVSRRAFVGVRVGATMYPDTLESEAVIGGLDAGWTFALGKSRRLSLCPTFDWSYQLGPNRRRLISLDYRVHTWTPAVTLARRLQLHDDVILLPYVTGAYQLTMVNTRLGVTRENAMSDQGGIGVGTGIQFRTKFIFRAALHQPLFAPSGRPAYAAAFGYIFTRKAGAATGREPLR